MMRLRRWLPLSILFLFPLLAACQAAPCERPPAAGYTRQQVQGLPLRRDAPAEWTAGEARLEQKDPGGEGLRALVEFYSASLEKYPHIYSQGEILTGQEWGSPFPGRAMQITEKKLDLGGLPGLTVSFDFEAPLTLMDGSSPVREWGYMQFTFLPVGDQMVDIRFYASGGGQEKNIRKEFDKLVNSICVTSRNGGGND